MGSKWTNRIGIVLTVIPVLFLMFDGAIKFFDLEVVRNSWAELGYPVEVGLGIAVVELVCLTLYVVPRTSVLGAVLLTGYLGGAIATHVRVGNPWFSHVLFPTYIAAMIWGGLFLRDARLRQFLPVRSRSGVRAMRSAVSAT
jgi:hypothetical protein